ncbi:hypothetical protein CI807_08520 [Pseudomonas sp. NS1(2017)]|nr:hypothetical protein CI807_08520 [Pseudomonas sp. NS1(2017)]
MSWCRPSCCQACNRNTASTVGASLLAKIANDDAGSLAPLGVLRFFASKLAPTEASRFSQDKNN